MWLDLTTKLKLAACWVPDPFALHPASYSALKSFLQGWMHFSEFQRIFSLPNSGYLAAGQCIVDAFAPLI